VFEIIGREKELASLYAFVEEAHAGPAALVLEGEAGIGKSTLWLAGVEHAHRRDFRVLASRPTEAERSLAHVGLGDLLEDVLDDALPALPAPRRHALEVAMLREEASGEAVDHRALAVAVRDVVQLLSEQEPILIAIDDVQWLDPSSSSALAFALRRLAANDVLVLLARRLADGTQPSEIDPGLGAERVGRMPVGPLSVGALHQFLHHRLGRSFARQTLVRIQERARGNPFFALELARVLDTDVDPLEPLPVPETLEELLRARIAGLPASTREALALVAAIGTTSESLLEHVGVSTDALEPAAAAHVIEREHATIRFTHPLLSSVLYQDLGEDRRSVHGRIAGVVEDPLLRARHLALSKDTPDADVAAALDEAARLADDRGASAVAAELAEQAVRLTPLDARDERRRRAVAAARAHQAAGEWTRARTIATDLLAETKVGSWRAEALILLAELESVDRGAALLEEALADAASRPALQSLIHCRLAWATRFTTEFDHAGAALELAEQLDDDALRARARAVQAILGWFAGDAATPEDLPALAEHLPGALGGDRLVQEATQATVNTLAPASRRDEARALLEREHKEWRERNEPRSARAVGASPGSSSGLDVGSSPPSTPSMPTTSRFSTDSRCRRTTFRSLSLESTAVSWSSHASTRSELSSWLKSSSGSTHPSTSRSWGSSLAGTEIRQRPWSGATRPTAGPRSSSGESPASAGGPPTTASYSSSSAESTTRSELSTPGRRTRHGSRGSGCSRM